MREIDPLVWFSTREIAPVPKHFVRASTPSSTESYNWVLIRLKGRFGIGTVVDPSRLQLDDFTQYFFFEDPADAMMYELRWSGQ